jgi:hypothetical protein
MICSSSTGDRMGYSRVAIVTLRVEMTISGVRRMNVGLATLSVVLLFFLSGCAGQAPSFALVGAYFPAWMFCALVGVAGAIAARATFVTVGLDRVLPFQLVVCASIGVMISALVWLLWFGR